MVPEEMGDTVEQLGELRERVKKSVPQAEERAALLKRLFAFCEEKDFQVTDGELEELLEALLQERGKG